MKRKKEKYVDTPIDKLCKILIYVILPVFVATIIFIIKLTSYASAPEYQYFPMEQNEHNIVSDTGKNTIDTTLNSADYYIFTVYRDTYNGRKRFYYVKFPKNQDGRIYAEVSNNQTQFSLYTVGGTGRFYIAGGLQLKSDGTLYSFTENFDNLSYFQNLVSSNYSTATSYMSNFKLYNNNTENKALILKYGLDEVPIITGHATPPDTFESPIYTTGHIPPSNVPPTITVNNYTWTTYTPPVIDDSGIIETIKSEIQVINYLAGWLKDNLQGMLTNLVNNIKNLFDYLVKTIQYYCDLIISNIQNLITTFYNNMVSIGEDIISKLTYIVSPLDTTALQTAIQNTGIYNDYDRIFDMVSDAFGFYNDIQEPNTFTIPIDLRNVTILHQTQIVYIDLGWLNSCKTIIRAFMWCVLTFGLLYTIIDSIPDYLQGNDE